MGAKVFHITLLELGLQADPVVFKVAPQAPVHVKSAPAPGWGDINNKKLPRRTNVIWKLENPLLIARKPHLQH